MGRSLLNKFKGYALNLAIECLCRPSFCHFMSKQLCNVFYIYVQENFGALSSFLRKMPFFVQYFTILTVLQFSSTPSPNIHRQPRFLGSPHLLIEFKGREYGDLLPAKTKPDKYNLHFTSTTLNPLTKL